MSRLKSNKINLVIPEVSRGDTLFFTTELTSFPIVHDYRIFKLLFVCNKHNYIYYRLCDCFILFILVIQCLSPNLWSFADSVPIFLSSLLFSCPIQCFKLVLSYLKLFLIILLAPFKLCPVENHFCK